ncbi:Vacuolar protein sorting-associated protein 41-like protein [Zea mays]|nr:Vacuolar protein sorting-associated protein 41-like protein [Zea mays]AQK65346.1 Vacuolar protein sorting-associated protein 41-like protein [Zea mays]AQK65347.1 Vacuolar protein sorting-associated protein 41-like protein [Zea mays]AQK98532.1 Vacuolar protein sorting-associated protein 41-like protein [Zea mays]AQK98533.1 Vacuolar protein sorting-associated protein 41-like protein [Zea mays]
MYDAIHDKIVNLMIVDNKRTVHLRTQHRDIILPYEVVEQLLHTSKKCDKRYLLHLYLHALFEIDIHAGKDFHDMQVELYADYETRMLLPFLLTSQHYRLDKAYEIFAQKELAVEFVTEQHDDELWEELIRQCLQKPEMVGNLLEHTVGNLDPLYIVSLVPDGLEIPRLQDRLVKIVTDYRTETSL